MLACYPASAVPELTGALLCYGELSPSGLFMLVSLESRQRQIEESSLGIVTVLAPEGESPRIDEL